MTNEKFGFHFEPTRKGTAQGPNDPSQQFFVGGSDPAKSLVRETGQNSLDARVGEGPVTMVFELAAMRTDDIPDIKELRNHIEGSVESSKTLTGHEKLVLAAETARRDEIMVLRISDFGTTGLTGKETLDDPTSPLTVLTRGSGISLNDGGGGSHGIGKNVGPMSSDMCTVLYTSLPIGERDVVLAGYSCLATHRAKTGELVGADGFYTELDNDDFLYRRNPQAIGPFDKRDEPGTDTYILGYGEAEQDPRLESVRLQFLLNFLPAIHRGNLIVEGRADDSRLWILNAETLPNHVKDSAESTAFYRALLDPSPFEEETERFGKIKLYINVDDSLEKRYHTITMRTPLMRVDTFRHSSIGMKYAAILECSDKKGNEFLRKLEPPEHNKWVPGRSPGDGEEAVKELKNFVKKALKSRVENEFGDIVEIKGLAKFLPLPSRENVENHEEDNGTPFNGAGTSRESATVQGEPDVDGRITALDKRSVRVSVRTPANEGGDSPTSKGKNAGGDKGRKSKGGKLLGKGDKGSGRSLIEKQDVRFRSWMDPANDEICLALTPFCDVQGDLELTPLGPGGTPEAEYTLPVSDAHITVSGERVPIHLAGNVLKDLNLTANNTTEIRLTMSTRRRYRLGVK
ncbi:hypothetical protein N9F54_00440 [Actinomycetota bacterium]|nr:hypothetical protein [Actinomycetota bacterium]